MYTENKTKQNIEIERFFFDNLFLHVSTCQLFFPISILILTMPKGTCMIGMGYWQWDVYVLASDAPFQ